MSPWIESAASFGVAAINYWWVILTGLIAPLLWDVPDMLASESQKSKWERLRPKIARHSRLGAFIALIIASFLAYHDERQARLKAETTKATQACGKIEVLGQSEGWDGEFKAPSITRLIRITGNPYSVTFEVRGGKGLGLRVKNRDTGRVDFGTGPKQIQPEGMRSTIQNPRGLYDVTVIAENPNAVVFSDVLKCEF